MREHQITIYQTHIEVSNYRLGDLPDVELEMSRKNKPLHCLEPIGYYVDESTDTLRLPKGYNIQVLERVTRSTARAISCEHPVTKMSDVKMVMDPKDENQQNGIDFLTESGVYELPQHHPQLGLNMPTGHGKTYCAIHAAVKKKYRPIVICHTEKIRKQWIESIEEFTSADRDQICSIEGSSMIRAFMDDEIDPLQYDFFIIMHQTITSFTSDDNWWQLQPFLDKLQIGVKILDETHLYLRNMLMIDFYTDIQRTWYLTATFGRSDVQQDIIYHKAYSTVFRFGECIARSRHTISCIVLIDSKPDNAAKRTVCHSNAFGYSAPNYMTYEYLEGHEDMMKAIKKCLDHSKNLDGIRMILSGLQASTETVQEEIQKEYPSWDVIVNHSKSPATTEEMEKANCISCTRQLMGTGADIKGLRVVILTEPMASRLNMIQTIGRLRPYVDADGKQRDTVFYYIVDMGFQKCVEMYERILPVIRRSSKSVNVFDLR